MIQSVLETVDAAGDRLRRAGYREREIGPGWPDGARAFRRSDFRVRWMLTRLHTSVLLVPLEKAGSDDVERLTEQAAVWAKRTKGGLPRGLQTGVAVLCVLVCGAPSDEALHAAAQPPRKRWAAIALPVVLATDAARYGLHRGQMTWGAVYQTFLAEQQRTVLGRSDAPVLGSSGSRAGRRALVALALVPLVLTVAVLALLLAT